MSDEREPRSNKEKYEIIGTKRKAGVFIVGEAYDGKTVKKKLHVIAPWIEGAFEEDAGKKAYLVPKGSLDEGERDDSDIYVYQQDDQRNIRINSNGDPILDVAATKEAYVENGDRLYKDYAGAWAGAKREVFEETGIDIDAIIRGEVEGVSVIGLKEGDVPEPVFENFLPSHRGNPCLHTMFVLEVDNIKELEKKLKQQDQDNPKWIGNAASLQDEDRSHHVRMAKRKPNDQDAVKKMPDDSPYAGEWQFPNLADMLQVLRTGEWHLGPNESDNGYLFDSDFREYEQAYIRKMVDKSFGKYLSNYLMDDADTTNITKDFLKYNQVSDDIRDGRYTISNLNELQSDYSDFFADWKDKKMDPRLIVDDMYQNANCQNTLKANMRLIRKHMENLEIIRDKKGLKFDTKHRPLTYFQEGADIIPFDEYVARTLLFAEENDLYRHGQFSANINDRRPGRELNQPQKSYADLVLDVAEALNVAEALKGEDEKISLDHTVKQHTQRNGTGGLMARINGVAVGTSFDASDRSLSEEMRALVGRMTEQENQKQCAGVMVGK